MALCLWSGGCDSTLLLHDLAASEVLKEDTIIRAVSITHPQIVNSTVASMVRLQILAELFKRGLKISYHEININNKDIECEQGSGAPQTVIWMSSVIPYLQETEDLYMGFIRSDDIWHFREYLGLAFLNLQILRGNRGGLKLPLEWWSKADVIQRLKKLGLYEMCWTCENPVKHQGTNKPCGKCRPCRTQTDAEYRLRKWPKQEGRVILSPVPLDTKAPRSLT